MTILEQIFKTAKIESEWMRYYGFADSRKEEQFKDVKFYDRMIPIGYSKVYTPLHIKCCMGCVNSLEIDNIENIQTRTRNHENSMYTCLEFVIHNKIEGYMDLIKLIKG